VTERKRDSWCESALSISSISSSSSGGGDGGGSSSSGSIFGKDLLLATDILKKFKFLQPEMAKV
jgi:hypothetical protein